ncbi:isoleucine--tRNA ligase [Elysia marginata]|uniref:isoleucine--tRNA ligase n=1 Tax=Elysia marginata TaxID=1093978 RepID=A0AAV4GI26_9GAST|nr:isoleucine--tRNA ligase [Elysia marginata]
MPGIHHVLARSIKDIFCRYYTQKGYQVKRKAGWDTHGLPVELGVEKELGITKEDIGKRISIAEYNSACKKAVMKYTDVWNHLTERLGFWLDMNTPYITYQPKYMESVWWLLKEIYKKGWLYKGYTIQPYSPKAGTGLSSHELNQPGCYKDVTDTSVVAQFKAIPTTLPEKLKPYKKLHFLAWTTTPWTLPSNTALTVGKRIRYAVVSTFNQYTFEPVEVLLAEDLVSKQFSGKYKKANSEGDLAGFDKTSKKIPYIIKKKLLGEEFLESRYEQLLPFAQPYETPENAFRIIAGDFVTTEDGTGIVHTAPTFGADDYKVAKEANPPVPPMLVMDENRNLVPLVDTQGKFRKGIGQLGGKYVKNEYYDEGKAPEKSLDVEIAILLKEQNKAFAVEKYKHNYPHCWRTDKPILYYPLDSWFIKVIAFKDKMYEHNQSINWKPESTGEKRFAQWLKNANDWNLSRSRYWGIPLPIWRTECGDEELVIGSLEELKGEIKKSLQSGWMKQDPFGSFEEGNFSEENYSRIDLHKNVVDTIVLTSKKGQPMYREADLIDVWFDSGSMPYAQWHYPFEKPEKGKTEFESVFPANFIAEGVDQTRGWFYTLHAIATAVFDQPAYKNVISNGLVLDKEGRKMSKRLGNAVDPFEVLDKYGADATRWYMIGNSNPWDNLKFDIEGVEEVKRKFFGTLYNTYSFFSLYANIDGFCHKEPEILINERPELDRWILSELHTLIRVTDQAYKDYEPTRVVRAISYFVQENLSNWYVRLSRRRFWKGDYQKDKLSAYQTLYNVLKTTSKLMAPIAPFYSEHLYRDLTKNMPQKEEQSVHFTLFPKYDKYFLDPDLESKMKKAQTISSMVLSLRKKERIKVRQPLKKILIPISHANTRNEIEQVADIIKSEVNIKSIEFLNSESDILVKQIVPNFKVIGPKYGKLVGALVGAIKTLKKEDITQLEERGYLEIKVRGDKIMLKEEDVEISFKNLEGWTVTNNNGITVALDITIDETLKNEGLARELINRIQNLRKQKELEVTDKIDIYFSKNKHIADILKDNMEYIKKETLATTIKIKEKLENPFCIEFEKFSMNLSVEKNVMN